MLVVGRNWYERSCTTAAPIGRALVFGEAPAELLGDRTMLEPMGILSDQPGLHRRVVESHLHRFGPSRDGCHHSSNIVTAYLADSGPAAATLAQEPLAWL